MCQISGCECGINTVIYLFCLTYEWLSSIFEVLFVFWLLVMYLISSWYETYVCVELLVDDVWEAEDDKTGFLSVGVDSFDRLFL